MGFIPVVPSLCLQHLQQRYIKFNLMLLLPSASFYKVLDV